MISRKSMDQHLHFHPANNDIPLDLSGDGRQRILHWLNRFARPALSLDALGQNLDSDKHAVAGEAGLIGQSDDWQIVTNICGYTLSDFISANVGLPLTHNEVDYFRRNHRGTESYINREFLTSRADLPSPLAELYGLYQHRVRVEAEATFFVAQATGSTRVARVMADLLAIGAFANGSETICHLGLTYSIPCGFDSSDIIDHANHEASRRLALPADHPAHLLRLSPDEVGVLAMNMAERHAMPAAEFLEKANLLSEARQDVTRLPPSQQFVTAIVERDLPMQYTWVNRLCAAYARLFEAWVVALPEVDAMLQ